MSALPRNSRLKRLRPKRVPKVYLREIQRLIAEVKAMPKDRRIDAAQFSLYLTLKRKLLRRLGYLEHHTVTLGARLTAFRYRAAQGQFMLSSRDPARILSTLIGRRCGSRNVHAMAMGKRTALKHGSAHMAEIGRKGAAVRWAKERERKALAYACSCAQSNP